MDKTILATITLVEDDKELSSLVTDYLQSKQYQVTQIFEGLSAVDTIITTSPDLVILDLMLPGKDGISICKELRYSYQGAILMLTASDDVFDQVTGLEIGADDYVQKPVEPRVLLARVRALLRRGPGTEEVIPSAKSPTADIIRLNKLLINQSAREVSLEGKPLELSTPEFEVLLALALNAGKVVSRNDLFQALRNLEYDGENRFIDITISQLRKKLGTEGMDYLKTVRGQGYLLAVPA